jgi:hypothetical protein
MQHIYVAAMAVAIRRQVDDDSRTNFDESIPAIRLASDFPRALDRVNLGSAA